ncbi:unnamed protein product [Mytilus edulis]|uniref:Uncharacterized protein n=1 Tax=Mytilus edulis TaxID=6550 RepID=A0A8S3V3H5_MYTED|nr:unnamed protein product [Mytilus edulis]
MEKINEYRKNIDTDKVDCVISKLNTYNDKENISKNDMNNLVHEVSDILIDSAKLTFGTNVYAKTMLRNSKKQNNKQWYDKDCNKAKKELRKSQRLYKMYGSNIFKERLRQNLNKNKFEDEFIIENDVSSSCDDDTLNCVITREEILKAVKKAKNNKSPGADQIINEYIASSLDSMIDIYVYVRE